jgi:hypothetical protein
MSSKPVYLLAEVADSLAAARRKPSGTLANAGTNTGQLALLRY